MRANRSTPSLFAVLGAAALAALFAFAPAGAQEDQEKDEAKEEGALSAKTVVTNLSNPCGVAVSPKTGHVFITNQFGLYRYVPQEPDPANRVTIEVLNPNLPETDIYGKGPKYKIGPLGVAFLDDERLVVGGGSREDGQELMFIYKLADEPPEEPLAESAAETTLGPIEAEEGVTKEGEGNFYAVAVGAGAIFTTTNGDDTKGWIAKASITDGEAGELTPSIATKPAVNVDAPVALTFSPDGQELVVGQMGEMTVPGDSLLCFYDPNSGELKRSHETGLNDITALAYSPETGKLYATDFAWADPSQGGLFELTIEGDEVSTKKVLGLDKPAAMAFDKQGNLYLAVFGTESEESEQKYPGTLKIIPAGL